MFRCYSTSDFDDLESPFREEHELILYYMRRLFYFPTFFDFYYHLVENYFAIFSCFF